MNTHILDKKIGIILDNGLVLWIGNLFTTVICAVVYWIYSSDQIIFLWASLNFVLFGIRLTLTKYYFRRELNGQTEYRNWFLVFGIFSFFAGLVWGLGAWLFLDHAEVIVNVLFVVALAGVNAGALPILSCHLPSYLAFLTPVIILLIAKFIFLGGEANIVIVLLATVFFLVNIFYSRIINKTILSTIVTDIKNKELLKSVSEARDLAEKANRGKSQFLAAVSHDLRQPLNSMSLFMESLERRLEKKEQGEIFDKIKNAHEDLRDMFSSLLEASKLETGIIKPVLTDFNLKDIVAKIMMQYEAEANKKNLDLNWPEDNCFVHSDEILVSRIIRNLVDNALKYTARGSIHIHYGEKGDKIELLIKDTGKGLSDSEVQRITTEGDMNAKSHYDSGIGLGVVKQITKLLDVSITIESSSKGSLFKLELLKGDIVHGDSHEEGNSTAYEHKNILVVDDDNRSLSGLQQLLEDWNCSVVALNNEEQAIQTYQGRSEPDLIICDYQLENNQLGTDLIHKFRDYFKNPIPALIITGVTDTAKINSIKNQSFYVLKKPIILSQLRKVMTDLLTNN